MQNKPRNPKSPCATCQYLTPDPHHALYCERRDKYIVKGYPHCEDYRCNPSKIPYKNGDWVLFFLPTPTNSYATQTGIIIQTNSRNHCPGVIIIQPHPRKTVGSYTIAAYWTEIIRTLTEKEIAELPTPDHVCTCS